MHLVKRRAHEFGVRGVNPDAITFDLAAAVARKDDIVNGIISGIYDALKKNKNITFFTGHAEFTSPVDIRVDRRRITAEKTILAVGSRSATVDIPGLAEVGFITNYEALKLERLPVSMIVIGGGYIGVEFAQMYARFGTKVTMLGRAPRVMPHEDEEVSAALAEVLRAEGIDVHTSAPVLRAEREGDAKVIVAQIGGEVRRFRAEEILFAGGRVSRVDELGLEQAGVGLSSRGVIQVTDSLQTTAPKVWSIGDANGGAMFTHRATYDGPLAALNAVRGLKKKVDYRVVPRAVFCEPAVASVGLTEQEAHEAGREVKVGKHLFAHTGRAKAIGQTEGFVKIVADAKTGELLGAHILGAHADILIHQIVTAMYDHGTAEPIAKSIHIHPTLSEAVKSAAKAIGATPVIKTGE
jgi:pyruvate/2-oxoglutarate dehydrogenase complex dihydrolipoamide dehydrogenase (E3) component